SVAQGSASVALAGVAHKIELSPRVLDFGIVLVGNTREQKLTVKNQGVTTVTIETPITTQNTASPFTVVLERPLTLSPGESKEILMRCSPTASGIFQEGVRLVIGSAILGIPAIAKTMTYEEYLQSLLEAHNTIVQDLGAYGMVYGWNKYRQFDFITAGFPNMSRTDFESLWDFAEQELSSRNAPMNVQIDPTIVDKLRRVLERLQAIEPDDLIDWMELLSSALEQGRFDEEYERLLPQGLDRYQAIFVEVLGLSPQDAKNIIRELVESLTEQPSLFLPDQPDPKAQEIKRTIDFINKYLKALYGPLQYVLPPLGILQQIASMLGLPDLSIYGLIDLMTARWDNAIRVMLSLGFNLDEMVRFSEAIRTLVIRVASRGLTSSLFRLGEFAKLFDWMTNYGIPRDQRDRCEQGLGTIYIAANAVRIGWQYNGLVLNTEGNYFTNYGDWWGASLLLSRSVSGRSIVTIARGDHCRQCAGKATEIGDWIEKALQLLPGQVTEYTANLGAITVVFTNPNPQGIGDVLSALYQRFNASDKVIIVVWMDKNGNIWWSCLGGCNNLKPGEAEQIACNMFGFPAGCGAKGWNDLITLPLSEVKNPMTIITEPMDWFEVDPWYFTREWLCRMTRQQAAGQGLEGLWDLLCSS
ncbi:MAG: choice-of-anchor D domain-containing protein, partial [Candidatus Bipolaricaulota bacterium]|nr:choice-of-anchor D domain-containing protein [Candidatus Bipolaricaulota bacterium]